MRNLAAAKLAARKILGRAWRGQPAFDQTKPWTDPPGEFPSGAWLFEWRASRAHMENGRLRITLKAIEHEKGTDRSHPGPKTGVHAFRDLYLALAVWHLQEQFGIKPTTRNRDGSGCAIVAEVATEIGIPGVTYQITRKAWEAHQHLREPEQ